MEDIVLVGSGGCMRELLWQIQELNRKTPTWNVLGYVDKKTDAEDVTVGNEKYPWLGNDDYLLAQKEDINVMMCVGEPGLRRNIAERLLLNYHLKFPPVCLANAQVCADLVMGKGCVVSMDSRISTNVRLGDFVFLNTGAKICHDGCVGSYTTLGPDVTMAGNVTVGEDCNIGLGAKIIQQISLGSNVTVGAGAVVVRNLLEGITAAGVPAKQI